MAESVSRDIYADAYSADRPALFFKGAGWRVRATGETVGIRPDSAQDVPEPELAVLCNRVGEVVAFGIGNDMGSRSIERANPLFLAQAKIYDASCAIGPAAVLAFGGEPALGIETRSVGMVSWSSRATAAPQTWSGGRRSSLGC